MVRLVARREFVERVRDKGFIVSTAITLLVLVGVVGGGALLARRPSYDLGVVGEAARAVAERARRELGPDVRLRIRALPSVPAAERAVREGGLDAALVEGSGILVRAEPDPSLVGALQRASARLQMQRALTDAGLSPGEVDEVLDQPPLSVRALEPQDPRRREAAAVAFVGLVALYGQLFAYGYWVAAGVVEEKSSRVVEVLLATVRPSQLLRGKILGIGLLGLLQLGIITAVGFLVGRLAGVVRFPGGALAVIALVLGWFLLGYAFYACLFAVAGAIVPRQEDLQATMTPLTILIIGALFVGIEANRDPGGTLALVASFLPPTAPLAMPARLVLGEAGAAQGLLAVVLSAAATAALVPLATRIYARAVLRPGRVRIREALRS